MKRARICILLALTLIFVLGFGSTALAYSDGPPCDISIKVVSDLDVTTPYTWSIDKGVDPAELTLAKGASDDVTYNLVVTKVPGESTVEGSMSSNIKVDIDRHDMARVAITAYVTEGGSKLSDTEQSFTNDYDYGSDKTFNYNPSFTPKAGSTYAVSYEGKVQWDYEGIPGFGQWTKSKDVSDSANISIDSTVDIVSPVSVTDVLGSLPVNVTANIDTQTWSDITDGLDATYPVTFTNNGAAPGTYTVTNTAVINQTEQSNSASFTIIIPKKSDPPEPRDERKVRWPDRTPPPEELEAAADAVPLPRTGGLIEWEWVALAGGMLTGGGGALCLIRRRRIKK